MSLELLPTNDPSCLLFQGDSTPGWRVVPGPDGKEQATPGLLIRQPHQTFFVEFGSLVPGVHVDDKHARECSPATHACSEQSSFSEVSSASSSSSATLPAALPSSPSEASTNPTKGATQLESSGSDVSKASASTEAEASDARPTSEYPAGTNPPGSVAPPPLPQAPATVAAPYVAHAVQHACIPCMPQQALPVGMVPMFHQPQVLYQAHPVHAPPHIMVPMPPTPHMYPPHMHVVQQMPVPVHGAAFPQPPAFPPPPPPVYHRPMFTPRPPNHPPPPIRGGVRGAPARKPETTHIIPESHLRPCRVATTSSAFDSTPEDTPEDTTADNPAESPTARAPETLTVSTAARADKDDDEDEDDSVLSPIRAKYDALRVASSSTIASPTYALGAARSLTWGASRSLTGMLSMMSLGAVPEVLEEEFEERGAL